MRFKARYKSCLWTKTNIWGKVLEKSLFKPKWDRLLGYLVSKKKRRYQKLCKNYNLVKPPLRPNQVYKYPRWNFRNSLCNKIFIRRFYGDLNYKFLKKNCQSKTSKTFIKILESRLDVNLYRLGFFSTIFESRQAILHGKVLVNGKKTTFDHFLLKCGDVVEFCADYKAHLKSHILYCRASSVHPLKLYPTPSWIQTDYTNLSFIVVDDINLSVFYPSRVDLDEVFCSIK